MKQKKICLNRVILYILVFIFFFCVFWKIPLVHDSWAGQVYNKSNNFMDWVISRVYGYYTLNGRIIAQIVVGFFERNKLLLDLANALLMVCLIALMNKSIKMQKKAGSIIFLWTLLLLVSTSIRVEVYFYATMIYLVPLVLFFFFLWYVQVYQEKKWNTNIGKFIFLCILGILNSCWIEHTGFSFVFVLGIYWIIDIIKNRKINMHFTVFQMLNVVSFFFMICSPGLKTQRQFESQDGRMTLIMTNVAKTIQAVVYEHKMLMLILILSCMLFMMNKRKRTVIFIAYEISMGFYLILFSINLLFEKLPDCRLPEFIILNALQNSIYGKIWTLCGGILVVFIFLTILFHTQRIKLEFVLLTGLFSLLPTIVTPNFGYRVCFFSIVLFMYIIVSMYYEIQWNTSWGKTITQLGILFALFVQVDMYSILVSNISDIQKERENRIELVKNEQRLGEWDYERTLTLPLFSNQQLYLGASPEPYYDNIHYNAFLDFYKLNPKTLVVFNDNNDELRVNVNSNIKFEVFPEEIDKDYMFQFYILNNGQIVWTSDQTNKKVMVAKLPLEKGIYYFKCEIKDELGNIKEVYSAKIYTKED